MCTKSSHNGPKLLQNHHNSTPHIILEIRTTFHQNSSHVYFSPSQVHTFPSQLSSTQLTSLVHTSPINSHPHTHHNNVHQCNNNKIICNMLQIKICKRV